MLFNPLESLLQTAVMGLLILAKDDDLLEMFGAPAMPCKVSWMMY